MPNITLTFGTKSYTHTVSGADATRLLNAAAATRGVAATADAVCPVLAKEFFQRLKNNALSVERSAASISDIPATES